MRAHLSHLLETERSGPKISFWYGARSKQEIFHEEHFRALALDNSNFHFHLALSSPLPEDDWSGHLGFIHQVLLEKYLSPHGNPARAESYLCGPPMMIKACLKILSGLNVPESHIAYDEF